MSLEDFLRKYGPLVFHESGPDGVREMAKDVAAMLSHELNETLQEGLRARVRQREAMAQQIEIGETKGVQ